MIEEEKYVIINLYVDDLMLTRDHSIKLTYIQEQLERKFEMSHLGVMKVYIGVKFIYLPKGVMYKGFMQKSSSKGLKWIVANTLQHPWKKDYNYVFNMGTKLIDQTYYQCLIGSSIFLTHTRLDLSFVISCVSRYMATS
jgi:hypothetical protein